MDAGFDWGSISSDALRSVASLVLNMLIDARSVDFASSVAEIASTHGQKPGIIKGVLREFLVVFQSAMKEGKTSKKIEAQLISQLAMPEDIAASVCTVWQDNVGRISSSLVSKTLKANALVDLDWNFGVTASSSEMDQVGAAFLQLKLTMDQGESEGGGTRDVFLELSVDQFYSFLSSMEQCKRFLDLVASSED